MVIEVVWEFKIIFAMVVMVVDSTTVGMGIGIVTKIYGMKVVIVSDALVYFGGGWLWFQKECMMAEKVEEEQMK